MNVVALLIGRGTTTQTITVTVPCLPLGSAPAQLLVQLVGASTPQKLTLNPESVIPSPCQALRAGTPTAMIGGVASIGITTIVAAGPLTPRSHGTPLPKGPLDRPQKPLTHPKGQPSLQVEVHARDHAADHPAQTQSAAPAAPAVAGSVTI